MTSFRGITWAHTRGFAPLATLGRVWEDQHPGQSVTWDARSLCSFGEEPLLPYLDAYDLLVFDYPFAGEALAEGWLHPLEELLPADVLAERKAGTVGPAFASFETAHGLAALPVDVATHVAVSRPDLLERMGRPLPATWDECVALARDTGTVAMPLRPTGVWGAFLTLCASVGDTPFRREDRQAFDLDVARTALGQLCALAAHLDPVCFDEYPVALLGRMAAGNNIGFIPLTYGYCTYALPGYGTHRLAFHDPRLGPVEPRGAVLGGAGIGVSARSRNAQLAAEHAAWLTSPDIQRTLYVMAGGQPAQRAAWTDPLSNALTNGFFQATLRSAEAAYVRPNGLGFHNFQNFAAGRLHQVVRTKEPFEPALAEVAAAWTTSSSLVRQ